MKLIVAIALAFSGAALGQPQPLSPAERQAKDTEKQRIEAQAKAEKAQCQRLEGNAEDVCEAQAKAKEKIAKAELDAKYDPSPRNQRRAASMKAEGEYEVAKQRCGDRGAAARDQCRQEARERYQKAQSDIERQYPVAAAGGSR
jgi:hypothetical protein